MFLIESGVIQGCPLSGTLFALAADPLLRAIHFLLQPEEICRAFADDIAVALASLNSIIPLCTLFNEFEDISALTLGTAKCIVVPLSKPCNGVTRQIIHEFLAAHVPDWIKFTIADAGEYLGFYIGPGAADKLWSKPFAKCNERNLKIAQGGIAPAFATSLSNSRATATVTYHTQLYPLPPSIIEAHRKSAQANLHLLNYTFPTQMLYRLRQYGDTIQHNSLLVASLASRARTAIDTIPTCWPHWLAKLNAARNDNGPLASIEIAPFTRGSWTSSRSYPSRTQHFRAHWTTAPIVDHLHQASLGFPDEFPIAPNPITNNQLPPLRAQSL